MVDNYEKAKGESSEWRTPGPSLLDPIGLEYGLDPCAPTSGYYAVRARKVFTIADDGLSQSWRGHGLVFCNPPWSEERRAVVPWLRKFFAEADGGLFIGVARTSAADANPDRHSNAHARCRRNGWHRGRDRCRARAARAVGAVAPRRFRSEGVMSRRELPTRRYSETFELAHNSHRNKFSITVGLYPEGDVGELFISGAKTGSDLEAHIHDAAIAISIALQYGAPLAVLAHAMTREANGAPSTVVGRALDVLTGKSFPPDPTEPQ
jgi:hypothetical protein